MSVAGDVITAIGDPAPGAIVQDIGDVALLPRLVNAHTHLEFSHFDRPLGRPGIALADWLAEVMARRNDPPSERSPGDVIAGGIEESRRSGVGLIGEIATPPWPGLDDPRQPVDIVAMAEVLGLSPSRAAERVTAAEKHHQSVAAMTGLSVGGSANARVTAGISPHAPYSTPPALIDRAVAFSKQHRCVLAMHVAESPSERELLCEGRGDLADFLHNLPLPGKTPFPWPESRPFESLLKRLSGCCRGLIVHGNDLRPAELDTLARHPNLSVVMCPRTHAYFDFPRHPVDRMIDRGIRVGLGTDSRASNPDLNLWREVQYLLCHRQDLAPERVLSMATADGAEALGDGQRHGMLAPGRPAAMIVVPSAANTVDGVFADLAGGLAAPFPPGQC